MRRRLLIYKVYPPTVLLFTKVSISISYLLHLKLNLDIFVTKL